MQVEPRSRLVVVGNGMVGQRFCERLVEYDVDGRFDVTVLSEEPRPAYDRVHLSEFFAGRTAEQLALVETPWFAEHGISLELGCRIDEIDSGSRTITAADGRCFEYDDLVLVTGSAPFVPPIPGRDLPGVFVYRTIEDLEAILAWGGNATRAAVIGGGLLGLEAAKALVEMDLATTVVEFAERLMPRQVDDAGGSLLCARIEEMGVQVMLGARTGCVLGDERVTGLRFDADDDLPVDMVVVSAGIRPRDELARVAGIEVGERGGIVVGDDLATSDPHIHAIGECALHEGFVYGLVAPGYEMADVLARRLTGGEATFTGADVSTKLKLLGVDVASFGDAFADADREATHIQRVVYEDRVRGVYQKVLVDRSADAVVGGILVGDSEPYARLVDAARRGVPVPERIEQWLFAGIGGDEAGAVLDDEAQVCSCNDVKVGAVREAVSGGGCLTLGEIKTCTKAGTGCGGCVPQLGTILADELEKSGLEVSSAICEHFAYTRQELFFIVKSGHIRTFDGLLESHGTGDGCEVCRPAIASVFAAAWNDLVLDHASIQDTNDRFLANIQRGGTYSVVPRVPGGEITPDRLIFLGEIAKKYDLYCKITGGQRIDLLGARVEQLPHIWKELVEAGFESGHAYGKAMRTVKSCVGSTWCRFGVQDSVGMSIRLEERYRGIRAPHKLKSAVSGCIRECAEAQSKDFGVIATEKGWNLYVGGNGGSSPRHADLFATDLDDDSLVRLIDRFLMLYIQTAKPLQRTARWLEEFEGGLEQLKQILIEDSLGITGQLEIDMQALVDTYQCEWKRVVEDPQRSAEFRHFIESRLPDNAMAFVTERGQKRPIEWPEPSVAAGEERTDTPVEEHAGWVRVARVEDIPRDGGRSFDHRGTQIAVFHFARRGEWYASQNACPHRRDMVLSRGLLGTDGDEPKVACPMHKKTFSLRSGKGLSDPAYAMHTFPVEVRGEHVWVKLPPARVLRQRLSCEGTCA